MKDFSAKILKIGINPYVLVPVAVLKELFKQAGRNKGPIPIKGKLNGNAFIQNLVKYSGKWRFYLNTPMRKAAGIDVGDMANVQIEFDAEPRIIEMHPKLKQALTANKTANSIFQKLTPSWQKEIIRYINNLKTEGSVDKNIEKVIQQLLGKQRFVGRD